jgi:hypothetical protein
VQLPIILDVVAKLFRGSYLYWLRMREIFLKDKSRLYVGATQISKVKVARHDIDLVAILCALKV